jgi:hypothetical protein
MLIACSSNQSSENNKNSLPLESNSVEVISDILKFNKLLTSLPVVSLPATIDIDNFKDSLKFLITVNDRKYLMPENSIVEKESEVYAIGKLKDTAGIKGIFYYIKYPIPQEETELPTTEITLVLYTSKGSYTDYKTLAIGNYGSGVSKMYSLNQIAYVYQGEMESIIISQEIYFVKDGKFITLNSTRRVFYPDSSDFKESSEYYQKLLK